MSPKLLLGLMLITTVGCGNSNKPFLMIDSSFTNEEMYLVSEATKEWADATDNDDHLVVLGGTFDKRDDEFTKDDWEDYVNSLFRTFSYEEGYLDIKDDDGFNGRFQTGTGNIVLVIDKMGSNERFYTSILHELGHKIGQINHIDGGIMQAAGAEKLGDPCVHQVDLDVFCAENECGPNAHSTCDL